VVLLAEKVYQRPLIFPLGKTCLRFHPGGKSSCQRGEGNALLKRVRESESLLGKKKKKRAKSIRASSKREKKTCAVLQPTERKDPS